MNTILSLLAKGEINCAGSDVMAQKNIFEENAASPLSEEQPKGIKPTEEQPGTGKVKTPTEKAKEEEERRAAEEARRQQEEEERKAAEEEKKDKKPGMKTKIMNWVKTFMVADEE